MREKLWFIKFFKPPRTQGKKRNLVDTTIIGCLCGLLFLSEILAPIAVFTKSDAFHQCLSSFISGLISKSADFYVFYCGFVVFNNRDFLSQPASGRYIHPHSSVVNIPILRIENPLNRFTKLQISRSFLSAKDAREKTQFG
ncbi:hypothetical protein [Cecembia rubra]|uniref:Uncharacterized protein n=1 Tax=Cecembia rubra TaxID=1485585 RepID=A0A2P8DYD1_9BACT|nr:hypothetical protein [Cecembia rubra]PSL02228.1 hypothetical protein CLV48_11010 [Cecembia rubra]